MNGAWFATTPDAGRSGFLERFRDVFGYEAAGPVTLAYDAMALTTAVIYGEPGRPVTDWRGANSRRLVLWP